MTISINLHRIKRANASLFDDFCTLDLDDNDENRVCVFFQGVENFERVAEVADKIQALLNRPAKGELVEASDIPF